MYQQGGPPSPGSVLSRHTCLSIDLKTRYRSRLVRISPALPNVNPCEWEHATRKETYQRPWHRWHRGREPGRHCWEDTRAGQKAQCQAWLYFGHCVPWYRATLVGGARRAQFWNHDSPITGKMMRDLLGSMFLCPDSYPCYFSRGAGVCHPGSSSCF